MLVLPTLTTNLIDIMPPTVIYKLTINLILNDIFLFFQIPDRYSIPYIKKCVVKYHFVVHTFDLRKIHTWVVKLFEGNRGQYVRDI
jgi:hypothetical protein